MQKLRPFYLDGVLRAEGRLENTDVDVDVKHPIILPKTSHFTELVIRQYHTAVGHSGTSHTWSEIRQRFWIVKGGAVLRNAIGKCILRKKRNSTVGRQLMADLPAGRLQIHKPSFFISFSRKNRVPSVLYAATYTCLQKKAVTDAVHSIIFFFFVSFILFTVFRKSVSYGI